MGDQALVQLAGEHRDADLAAAGLGQHALIEAWPALNRDLQQRPA
jgi:hypothetical protein